MLLEERQEGKYKELLEKAVEQIQRRGFKDIRVKLDGYEEPKSFSQKKEDNTYIPDITATNSKGKFYFEIAQKTNDTTSMVSKWKLLSTIAEMKNGGLNILVPYGQNKFTNNLVEQYNIKANLLKMN
ncbi:MAG: hypothetical protein RJQ00_06930 [Vicingaceae bacterium]